MKAIWFWISKDLAALGLCIVGILIMYAWYGISDLISKFKRRGQKKKKGGAK